MDKRYQVFVSSTFADLQEERAKVIQTIMELDCIPAGMEIFPAIDEEQFEFIKRVIDDCDYYLLIIGGRYGSVSDDGVSYTEKEYEYAINKGLRVIAFLHNDPSSIPAGKSETKPESIEKLNLFRNKAATNRLVKFWKSAEDLPGLVALSLSKTIKTYPAVGWIRGNLAFDNQTFYKEIGDLRKENQELREIISNHTNSLSVSDSNLDKLDETVKITGGYYKYSDNNSIKYFSENWIVTLTWAQIFGKFGPLLMNRPKDLQVRSGIAQQLSIISDIKAPGYTASIYNDDYQIMKLQFKTLGLININHKLDDIRLNLTEKGEQQLLIIKTSKKAFM